MKCESLMMVAVFEYSMPIQDIVEARTRQEFIQELRSLVSNGGVENLSQTAINRLMLALLTDILDVGDTAMKVADKNAASIKELRKASLIIRYRSAFEKHPYAVFVATSIAILYLIVWVIHTWGEFTAIWTPIYEFLKTVFV